MLSNNFMRSCIISFPSNKSTFKTYLDLWRGSRGEVVRRPEQLSLDLGGRFGTIFSRMKSSEEINHFQCIGQQRLDQHFYHRWKDQICGCGLPRVDASSDIKWDGWSKRKSNLANWDTWLTKVLKAESEATREAAKRQWFFRWSRCVSRWVWWVSRWSRWWRYVSI